MNIVGHSLEAETSQQGKPTAVHVMAAAALLWAHSEAYERLITWSACKANGRKNNLVRTGYNVCVARVHAAVGCTVAS